MSNEFGVGVFDTAYRLAIDVGNSRVKLGLFRESDDTLPECVERAVVFANDPLPWDKLIQWKGSHPDWRTGVMAGSDPQGVSRVIAEWPNDLGPPPRHITNDDSFPMRIDLDEPRRVGIDRLLNAVAVRALLRHSAVPRHEIQSSRGDDVGSNRKPKIAVSVPQPTQCEWGALAVIVDSGTATTVDVLSSDEAFVGGAILPGLALSAKALHHYTALLPLVSVEELGEKTPPALGRNTRDAIRSGLFWGQLGAVKELIARQAAGKVPVFVTGGGGALLARFLDHATFEPHLALQGLILLGDSVE